MAEIGILVIDDDIVSQRALKNILDSEGWRVRILPSASRALAEIATGDWRLIIVSSALVDLQGSLFSVLRELAQTEPGTPIGPSAENGADNSTEPARDASRKGVRVLFLVPLMNAEATQAILEHEALPYTLKPYHLRDFLEKVSELLVEAGAIEEPIRTMGGFSGARRRRTRNARDSRGISSHGRRDG